MWREHGKLGWGSFGVVYAATREEDLDALPVHAIKKLQRDLAAVEEHLRRFEREIDILAALDHPSVMPVVDRGVSGRVPWFVMPLADDGSLKHAIADGRCDDRSWALRVVRGVLAGLAHAHERGVLHRDVKPSNVLLFAGNPKLSDFGIAKQLDLDGTTLTATAQQLGTLRYMAPEQLADAKRATAAADVYAAGKVAAYALSGVEPEPMRPPDLSVVPEDLRYFISRCCHDDPARRYQDGGEAFSALEELLGAGASVVLPPAERMEELLALAVADPEDDDVLERLDVHVRAHPEEVFMHRKLMPKIPSAVLVAWAERLPDGFREAMRDYDVHAADHRSYRFEYCDVVANFYEHAWGLTSDIEVKRLILARLLDMGHACNRWHVRDVLVDILASLSSASDVALAADELRVHPEASAWAGEIALKRPMRQPIAEAMREASRRAG